ncbi:hypothetical protein CCR75_007102 [Bremia lactucae]|uniref:Uncharacterized protein n=1 Tax=Bremia lactucae TaxID=4779 RepID=A0A976FPS5_BRELC|nr:hypothetical protein CCR75_007102 [Bremia lactucae]
MQLRPTIAALVANVAVSTHSVMVGAVACAEICYGTELTGFGPGGIPGCSCSGLQQGARTGDGSCSCGQCYEKAQGKVFGFAINADGMCTYGTDCGTCDFSLSWTAGTDKPANVTSTPEVPFVPATPAPALTTEVTPFVPATVAPSDTVSSVVPPIATIAANNSSASTDNSISSAGDEANSSIVSPGAIEELATVFRTWQIVLALCCFALLFIVVVVAVCACYCKARSRLNQDEDDHRQYPQRFEPLRTGPIVSKRPFTVV